MNIFPFLHPIHNIQKTMMMIVMIFNDFQKKVCLNKGDFFPFIMFSCFLIIKTNDNSKCS